MRREYTIEPIVVNRRKIVKVIIDPHYELKHKDSINDELILELVKHLNNRNVIPEGRGKNNDYSYFSSLIRLRQKQYRLVWLLEDDSIYIGVVNAFRDDRRK